VYNLRIKTNSHQNKKTAELHIIIKGNSYMNLQIDHDEHLIQWLHPAYSAFFIDEDNTQVNTTQINIYKDGSKSEQGVEAGISIKRPRTTTVEVMYKMDTMFANNQAEAFAILKGVVIRTNRLGKRRGQRNKSVYR